MNGSTKFREIAKKKKRVIDASQPYIHMYKQTCQINMWCLQPTAMHIYSCTMTDFISLFPNYWNQVISCHTEPETVGNPALLPTPNCPSSGAPNKSVGQATSMSLSNQGIHCSGSGYSLATGPHPALLAVQCCFERSCLPMPGSLTRISRECLRREMPRVGGKEKNKKERKNLWHNHHLP